MRSINLSKEASNSHKSNDFLAKLAVSVSITVVASCVYLVGNMIYHANNFKHEDYKFTQKQNNIYGTEMVDPVQLNVVKETIKLQPENVQEKIKSTDMEFYVTDSSETKYLNDVSDEIDPDVANEAIVVGEYVPKMIMVSPEIELVGDNTYLSQVTTHELGHFVYDVYGLQDRWAAVSSTEKDKISEFNMYSDINDYNDYELFAEAYREYVNDPETLKEASEEIFSLIDKTVNS